MLGKENDIRKLRGPAPLVRQDHGPIYLDMAGTIFLYGSVSCERYDTHTEPVLNKVNRWATSIRQARFQSPGSDNTLGRLIHKSPPIWTSYPQLSYRLSTVIRKLLCHFLA